MQAWWDAASKVDRFVVRGVILEFDSMHLNDMIPAAPATVDGLAGYLLERLSILGVTKVEVYESDTGRGAEVERLPG